jgi:hypothetical protein
MAQDDFDWGQLPREWWLETAATCGATEKHAKFAAAKHRGATNADAARASGFGAGNDKSARSEGYRLARSNRIMNLLALAATEAGGGYDGTLTRTESRQILTGLARGSDPALKIKAIESLNKLEADSRGEDPKDDGFGTWRLERDFLLMRNGASAFLMLGDGNIGNLCLLHDTYFAVMREEHGPELWQRLYARLNEPARADLDRHLADPGWQADARRRIWGEIDRKPLSPIGADAADMLQRDSVANQSFGAAAPEPVEQVDANAAA